MKKRLLIVLFSCAVSLLFAERFSVLYFNVWSGLSGKGIFTSKSYEQPGAHDFRFELLIDGLKQYAPTFTGLSELNPLHKVTANIIKETNYIGIPFGENGGLRVSVVGLPLNLYSGSAVFGSRESALEEAGVSKLSGAFAGDVVFAGSARKLLICRGSVKGQEIFIALTNWSEALYANETNFRNMVTRNGKGALEGDEMLSLMRTSMKTKERRLKEAQGTVDFINRIAGQAPVILMGTLACASDSDEYQLLIESGFKDAWKSGEGITWDETRNTNIKAQEIDLYKDGVSRDRVDYIMYRGAGLKVLSSRLVFNRPTFSTYPSDHFGLLSTFDLQQ